MRTIIPLAITLIGAWAALNVGRAHACSCLDGVIVRADPEDGADAVPLNIAPVLRGYVDLDSISLEDEHGAKIAVDVDAGPAGSCNSVVVTLRPKRELAANTRYTIHAEPSSALEGYTPQGRRAITFTTSGALLPDPELAPPQGAAEVVSGTPEAFCFSGRNSVCIAALDPVQLEVRVFSGTELLMLEHTLSTEYPYTFEKKPDCIELRRRSRTGRRSEPLRFCGDALPTRAWPKTDDGDAGSGDVLECRGGRLVVAERADPDAGEPTITSDAGQGAGHRDAADGGENKRAAADAGCAVAAPRRRANTPLTFWLMLALVSMRRRRTP